MKLSPLIVVGEGAQYARVEPLTANASIVINQTPRHWPITVREPPQRIGLDMPALSPDRLDRRAAPKKKSTGSPATQAATLARAEEKRAARAARRAREVAARSR